MCRLCQPMVDYFTGKGGSFRYNARLQKIQLGTDGKVEGFQLSDGSTVTGDLYISAMPGELAFHGVSVGSAVSEDVRLLCLV